MSSPVVRTLRIGSSMPVDLVKRVVTVSLEAMAIVNALPPLTIAG